MRGTDTKGLCGSTSGTFRLQFHRNQQRAARVNPAYNSARQLTKSDPKGDPKSGGQHHIIPLAWVDKVDARVHLNKNTKDAITQWQAAA